LQVGQTRMSLDTVGSSFTYPPQHG
jgi:hypothetical protein